MNNIKPEYYTELDTEFKKKYEEYIGINPNDNSNLFFTEKQQIERYARNVAFWRKEMVVVTFDSDDKKLARSFMTSKAHSNIIEIIIEKFDKNIQDKIMARVEQLLDDTRNNEIKRIKKKLELIHNISLKYYEEAKNDLYGNQELVDPVLWLHNQDKMRKSWEEFKNKSKNDDLFCQILVNNKFSKYMDFMYDNYPENFSNTLKYNIKENGYSDGAEIYYDLTK